MIKKEPALSTAKSLLIPNCVKFQNGTLFGLSLNLDPTPADWLGVTLQNPRPRKVISSSFRRLLAAHFGNRTILLSVITVHLIFESASVLAASLSFGYTIGGNQYDTVRAIATDGSQNIYIAGETHSNDFPNTSPSVTRSAGDAFIVKLNPSGTQILYSIILGGSGYDSARGIAVDLSGNAYVTGVTESSDFPTTIGAFQMQSASPGLEEAFIVKVNFSGSIAYASYLGGAASDIGNAIAVDSFGAAYVAGSTASANFPVSAYATQRIFQGSTDCFISKIDPTGTKLSYSTFLGGQNIDLCKGIAVDASGNAFVTGITASTDFPTASALGGNLSGIYNAFAAKIGPLGDQLLFSTYLGGESVDEGNAIAIGSNGLIYIGGDTTSALFPVSPGAQQTSNHGGYDGFFCAITNDGTAIQWCTFLGGAGADAIESVCVAPDGHAVVSGFTASQDFPLVSPIQAIFGGGPFDAFVAAYNPLGNGLDFSTFLGGVGDDRAFGIACPGTSQWIVAGQLLARSVSYIAQDSPSPGGQLDGFLAAISTPQGLSYVPITPCRVADTRSSSGFSSPFGTPSLAAGTTRDLPIPSSGCGIPAAAQAYALNIAVVPHSVLGYLTLWPSGQTRPLVATLNSVDGRTKSSAAIIPAGTGGAISVFATNDTDVVLDIDGYFVLNGASNGLAFYPLTPCRIIDTRINLLGVGKLIGGGNRTLPVLSSDCGLPPIAQAYSLNFVAIASSPLGYLTAYPTGTLRPLVAALNDVTGTITANAAIISAGSGGSIDVFATNDADLVVDIDGYFAPSGPNSLNFYVLPPCRALDTRQLNGTGQFVLQLNVDIDGVCGGASSAKAFVLNATVLPSGPLGYLTLWPEGIPLPIAATLNAVDGVITNNMAIVPTINGYISAFATNFTHLILDMFGYFAP